MKSVQNCRKNHQTKLQKLPESLQTELLEEKRRNNREKMRKCRAKKNDKPGEL